MTDMTANTPEPQPIRNDQSAVWPEVVKDMTERNEIGIRKYGTPLQPHNGRKAIADAYQESLDLAVYLKQHLMEHPDPFEALKSEVRRIAVEHGWWQTDRNDGEMIALMHSELSEALEALRHGNPASEHIPDFTGVEEELADVIIRILDYSAARNLLIWEAVKAKMAYNETRPVRHGKLF